MEEKDIMELITQDFSWEQVLYKVIAWEGLDPWDLDISKLSSSFIEYAEKLEEFDFKVPAKYVIIAAVLLRMKSEHMHFIDWLTKPDEGVEDVSGGEIEAGNHFDIPDIKANPITMPPVRYARRKIMADELVLALRKVLKSQEKRETKHIRARGQIKIEDYNITERISSLHKRITDLLSKIDEDEIKFSQITNKWERKDIINTFIPLIFLHHENKIACRQEELFDEIFVSHPPPETVRERGTGKSSAGGRMRRLVPAI